MDFDDLDDALEARLAEGGEIDAGMAAVMAGSGMKRTVTLKVLKAGGDEASATLDLPVDADAKVGDLKSTVAEQTLVLASALEFLVKDGPSTKTLENDELAPAEIIVKGVKDFRPQKKVWPHPTGIIGTGYHGLKTAMHYLVQGNEDIVCFDRFDRVGGYCWITGANKTSRLQTEFGAFHVWWGPDCLKSGLMDYPNCREGGDWHIWPYKEGILAHFQEAAEKFGVLAHVCFKTNVSAMKIVGNPDKEDRYYNLISHPVGEPSNTKETPVSILYHFPGSLTQNRIIEYPGEDTFEGQIRYGMNDDTPYEALKGSTIAILGNGAFAVENARTCLECGGNKAYIITRRKNLASPRMPCWFVHQAPLPVPGRFVLKMFEPMYSAAKFGDPWEFWSVHADTKRFNVTILQASRFGIGDVTFLMHAWGLLEYKVDTLKRCSKHTLHLTGGEKIEGVTVILKALGLLGEWAVDKLQGMDHLRGQCCQGDWRRVTMIDATGMNAANFTTFSTGIGTTGFCQTWKYLYDFPDKFYAVQEKVMRELPVHKAEPDLEKPAYVTEVKYAMTTSIILATAIPELNQINCGQEAYKYYMYHASHNLDQTLKVARKEWDAYQEDWKSRGIEHEYTPYPYTRRMLEKWFSDYSDMMKVPVSADGPSEEGLDFGGQHPGKPLTMDECLDFFKEKAAK